MKKKFYLAIGLLVCTSLAYNAFAADISNTGAGEAVTITAGVTGANDIVFTPSTNVFIDGESSAVSFAVAAWHEQALDKDVGQAYGMASDSNKMYWEILSSGAPTIGTLGTNGAASFSAWNTM